tara:strand:+ start:6493 stop:7179 length:687 start_codon:yes stop_codon:yes gene_type:complete
MTALPLRTVPTQDALALACAAHRINKGYVKETRRFSEDNPTIFSNKEILAFTYKNQDYTPHDWKPVKATEEDYEHVSEIQKWLKRYIMLGLGNIDDFKRDMIESVSSDVVPISNLGRIAFMPAFVIRDKHENSLSKQIRIEYRNSQYVGKEKASIEGVIKILDQRYSSQWESYNYVASMDGNLVSFMNKFDHPIGSMKKIKAKVKSHTKNRLFEVNETRLNYVKLYKV